MEPGDVVWALMSWLGVTTIGMLVAWSRAEVRINQQGKSIDRLWAEFDSLHPRRSNPGHRVGVNHGHEEERNDG